MDTPISPRSPTPAPRRGTAHPILVVALRHLLARDGDRPARWSGPRFAAAVDAHRRAPGHLSDVGAGIPPTGFADAVAVLSRDPRAVAHAIEAIEDACRRPLGPWRVLLRAGVPPLASEDEAALWFG